MGDLVEPENPVKNFSKKTVMNTVTESLAKNFQNTDDHNKLMNQENQLFLRMTLRKKNKLNNIIAQGIRR